MSLLIGSRRNFNVRIKSAPNLKSIRPGALEMNLERSKLVEEARFKYENEIVKLGQTQKGIFDRKIKNDL